MRVNGQAFSRFRENAYPRLFQLSFYPLIRLKWSKYTDAEFIYYKGKGNDQRERGRIVGRVSKGEIRRREEKRGQGMSEAKRVRKTTQLKKMREGESTMAKRAAERERYRWGGRE